MDNSSRVEINRLLNSNASEAVKKKAEILLSYLEEPTFDSLSDNISYQTAFSDPVLYEGCWVIWSGRVTNVLTTEELYKCDLLVGYENLERIDGIVSLSFPVSVASVIHGDRPVKVLARIGNENGRIVLTGRSVYQPLGKD